VNGIAIPSGDRSGGGDSLLSHANYVKNSLKAAITVVAMFQSFNYLLQKAQGSVVHLNIPVPRKSRYSLFLVPQVHYRLALCKGI
ncbi:hypothetical protein, partial [Salmonella enterica]